MAREYTHRRKAWDTLSTVKPRLRSAIKLACILAGLLSLSACVRFESGQDAFRNQDYSTALARWKILAEFGDARAQNELGWLHEKGLGTPRDAREAVRWYRAAAEQGLAEAQRNLGVMLERGSGVTRDTREASRWFQLASSQNDAAAFNNLGALYSRGDGLPVNHREAARLFRIAADRGIARAKTNLGLSFQNGTGVPQDLAQAAVWFKAATEDGDIIGMNNYGALLDNGRGVRMDKALARTLFERSAKAGYAPAAVNLAKTFLVDPPGSEQPDLVTAHAWLNIAASLGDASASSLRSRLEQKMTASDITAAQSLSTQLLTAR